MKLTIANRFWLWTILAILGFVLIGFFGYRLSVKQQVALQIGRNGSDQMAMLFNGNVLFQQTMESYQKAIVKIMLGESPAAMVETMQKDLEAFAALDLGISPEDKAKPIEFLKSGIEKIKKNNSYDAAEWIAAPDNPADALRKWLAARVEEQRAATISTGVAVDRETASIKRFVLFIFILIAVILTAFSVVNIFQITRPVLAGVNLLVRVAEKGDISEDVPAAYLVRGDEIGQLAKALQQLVVAQRKQADIVASIADGNWVQNVTLRSDKDTFSLALQGMVDQMNAKLHDVNDIAMQVNAGAAGVGAASEQLSQAATVSAASLQEISSTMTEVDSRSKQNAKDAQIASELVLVARKDAEKGTSHMDAMNNAMQEIRNSSQQIAKIIKVIDDIAFQTNLLALNAAVEAARAGRHGKGFAVVADEVRNLAGRSAKAAKETAELIESSGAKVENGTSVANQTAAALNGIVTGISKAADLISNIASLSNEQANWIAEISAGLGQIDNATQQNSANAEEIAASAVELSSHANSLHESVAAFKLKGR
jgi:methyl-accepting chemotaxis protein